MKSAVIGPRRYACWRATPLGSVTERLEHDALLGLAGPLAGRRVLDIGCGDGTLAGKLVAGGAVVTGIDSDPEMVAVAAAAVPSATIMVADAASLPFAEGAFDAVAVNTVLCLVENRRTALAEAARVLRPGGRLVLGELGRWSPWAAKRWIKGWFGSRLWRGSRFSDARSLGAELAEAGLTVAETRGAIFYPPWDWAARLAAPIDSRLGRFTTIGAAYIGVASMKRRDACDGL